MIKLHLGCGKRNFGLDWIHIDGGDFPHLALAHSVTDLSLIESNTVDLIYASHLIAYFDQVEILEILNEWKRVLKPGGVLRLATPDFNIMTKLYQESKVKYQDIVGPLYGRMEMMDKFIYHKTCYDYTTLRSLLEAVRFTAVKEYDWRETEHAQFDDHSQAYLYPKGDKEKGTLISLNLECIKP